MEPYYDGGDVLAAVVVLGAVVLGLLVCLALLVRAL